MSSQLVIESWTVDRFVAYTRKLRKNDHAVARMEASIQEFGFKIPVLALRNGEVVDGDLRIKAARNLGMAELPVIVCDGWTEAQVQAFRLAVNRSATWAEWDLELVGLEIRELKALDFNLALTGFDSLETNRFLFQYSEDPDSLGLGPAGSPGAISREGDVWICCGHRVLCGNAIVALDVARVLNGSCPPLMVIDQPYGVNYDPDWRERADLGHQRQTGKVANDDRIDWSAAYALFPGDVIYAWHAGVHAAEVARGLEACGFVIRAQIIWAKQHFAMSRGDYHWQHEPCWYAVREGKASRWSGDRTQSTLWEVPNLNPFGGSQDEEASGHGTQKPVELMRRAILNNTRPGEIVYDAFLGSGTTLVAAELTDRLCFGIDIDPSYVDMTVKRWQKLTGKQAILEGTDRTFDQIAAEGHPEVTDAAA